ENLMYIRLLDPDDFAPFNTGFIVFHDDFGDYSTNEPIMDGTGNLTYLLSAYGQPCCADCCLPQRREARRGLFTGSILAERKGALRDGRLSPPSVPLSDFCGRKPSLSAPSAPAVSQTRLTEQEPSGSSDTRTYRCSERYRRAASL